MKDKTIFKRVASLALAVVMMLSVLVVVEPLEAKAAESTTSISGSGTQTVTITDEEIDTATAATGGIGTDYYYKYIPFKPSKTGYITLTFSQNSVIGYTVGTVRLYKSDKKTAISTEDVFQTHTSTGAKYASYGYTVSYGVNGGTKYCLKVKCAAGTKIKVVFNKKAKSKANTKKKAKSLKANKTAEGVMIANNSKADWYKIKLTKAKKVKLIFNVKTHSGDGKLKTDSKGMDVYNGIKFSFYNSKGKLVTSKYGNASYDYVSRLHKKNYSVDYFMTKNGKKVGLPKGTYYVKVERANKNCSGYYTLKWK